MQALMEIPQTVYERDWAAISAVEQRAFFAENGFLVVPEAFFTAELETMYREIEEYALEKSSQGMWRVLHGPVVRRYD